MCTTGRGGGGGGGGGAGRKLKASNAQSSKEDRSTPASSRSSPARRGRCRVLEAEGANVPSTSPPTPSQEKLETLPLWASSIRSASPHIPPRSPRNPRAFANTIATVRPPIPPKSTQNRTPDDQKFPILVHKSAPRVHKTPSCGRVTPTCGRVEPSRGRVEPSRGRVTALCGRAAPSCGRAATSCGRLTPASGPLASSSRPLRTPGGHPSTATGFSGAIKLHAPHKKCRHRGPLCGLG